jgi:hypothetical protein
LTSHVDLALDDAAAAGRATPPLHEYGSSTPLRKPASSRFSLPFSSVNVRAGAVDHHGRLAFGMPTRGTSGHDVRVPGNAGGESLHLDASRRESLARSASGHGLHHAFRPHTNAASIVVEVDPVARAARRPWRDRCARAELDVLRLARQHVDEVEAVEVASLSAASSSLNITVLDARLP